MGKNFSDLTLFLSKKEQIIKKNGLLLLVGFGVCVGKYVVGFDGGKEGIVMFSVDGGVMLRML